MLKRNHLLGYSTLIASTIIAISCAADPDQQSQVKVTNGAATSDFPEVAELDAGKRTALDLGSRCTGTFVSKTTLITAAHCLDAGAIKFISNYGWVTKDRVEPKEKIEHPKYKADKESRKGISRYDIAVLIYPDKTAPAIAELATQEAKPNDKVTIVGFGNNDEIEDSGDGTKRFGTNVVKIINSGFILIEGKATSGSGDGVKSGAGAGDSGGPLFINGFLAGITTGSRVYHDDLNAQEEMGSMYINLLDPEIQKFLRDAVHQGADIPGL